jgi:bifunctional DNA-binding transcriptional regulator/antitoxin component of YhaV-PrlF toxin-antitoxin module
MRKPKRPSGLSEEKTRYREQRDAGRSQTGSVPKLPPPEALPNGTVRYFLKLGPKGRVLLPAEMRAALGLEAGDLITAWLKDGEVRLHSHLHGLRKIQDEAYSLAQGSAYASDQLIAERRAENAKDEEENLQWLRLTRKKRD